jgi:hypothetical protein
LSDHVLLHTFGANFILLHLFSMKKIVLFCCLTALAALANAQIVITEIMFNPPESGTDSLEYLELYNNSNASIDISGWNFTQGIEHVFASGTVVPAGGYVVLAKNANAFKSVFGVTPTVWTNGALTNTPGEDIELRDASANVIDYVDYLNASPWPAEGAGMGSSIVLCDYGADNTVAGNWVAAQTGTGVIINNFEVRGNPYADSGCGGTAISPTPDAVVAPTGLSSIFNVLFNDLFLGTVSSLSIDVQPAHGGASVSDNKVVYTPNQTYCGPDQLVYKVCNTDGQCGTAVVTIEVRCYPSKSISEVSGENAAGEATSAGVACELRGVVYGYNIRPLTGTLSSTLFTIIDEQGNGISVSSLTKDLGYQVTEKDEVIVRGVIGQFNGMTEIRPDTILKLSDNNSLVQASVVTSLSEATESQLIRINNLRLVNPAEWTTGVGGSGFNVRAVSDNSPLDTILIRIDRDVETYNTPAPPEPFDLRGIGGQFDATTPFASGYQVLPRYNADISTYGVGTKENQLSIGVTVSPNPATDAVTVKTDATFNRLIISDALGRILHTVNTDSINLNLNVSSLQPGVYFLRLEKDNAFTTVRFVKQ